MYFQTRLLTILCACTFLSACSPSGDDSAVNTQPEKPIDVASIQENIQERIIESTADDFPYTFEKIAGHTWVMHGPIELPNPQNKGFMNNPGIVVTSAGLVMIDPGSTVHIGNNVLAEVEKVSNEPIVAIFNTHIHGDHWLANQAVKAVYPDVKIYGHPKMLAEIENGEGDNWLKTMNTLTEGASEGTIVVAPDNTVDNEDMIKIGETTFKIHHYGIAHTKTDIMIEVVEESVIFLGDNVLSLRIPRTSDGKFQGNIDTINTILEGDATIFVPGHGPTGDRAMVKKYLAYLTFIHDAAYKTFEENLDSSDVISITSEATAEYKDWFGYDELLGPQGAQAYSEVEAAEF